MNERFRSGPLSRRQFLGKTAVAGYSAAVFANDSIRSIGAELETKDKNLPIVVFSKIYQTLKLSFDDAAILTRAADLSGVDCPVRPGGEILPERAGEDLPRYVEALRKQGLQLPLLTTAITNVSSPHAERILRTAKKLGVQYYRLGFVERRSDQTAQKQVEEVRAQLRELSALNKAIGIGAIFQNHSPAGRTYLGGDLNELYQIVVGFDPAQVGIAFDIAHALIVHGDGWRPYFEKLKSHLTIAYMKDAKRGRGWTPFSQGDVGGLGYFDLLRQMHYHAPVSMHIEYDWLDGRKEKTREALVRALKESSHVLRRWLIRG